MSSLNTRPRRSTIPACPAQFESILEDAYDWEESKIHDVFKTVCKYFKEDPGKLAEFWLTNTDHYNLKNSQHIALLRWVFEKVGLKHEKSVDFLHKISKNTIRSLGLQRVEMTNGTIYYRIIMGEGCALD